jgi:mannose-6-phosphate isomerase-like protein (cupin superfamily)
MRPIRPFDLSALEPGRASDWLIDPSEEAGVFLRVRRGDSSDNPALSVSQNERFALVLEGVVRLITPDTTTPADVGELLFIPAGMEGAIVGDNAGGWVEFEAPVLQGRAASEAGARVFHIDPSKFEGEAFAYQALSNSETGSQTMQTNVLQVAPGAGSPDWHIHAFCQIYIIQEGEMTVEIGRHRHKAPANSVVVLPAGVVHRNFNASGTVERHVSLLVPEPRKGEIFDYAVTIHDVEAVFMAEIPA